MQTNFEFIKISFFINIILISCQSSNNKISIKYDDSLNQQMHQEVDVNKPDVKFITDDEFIASVIGDLSSIFFSNEYNILQKQILKNKFNPNVNDTLFVFSNKKDTLNFYKTPSKIIIQNAIINSDKIILTENISIGVDVNVLKSKFDLLQIPDTLIIENIEGHLSIKLIVLEGKLTKITYTSNYLD